MRSCRYSNKYSGKNRRFLAGMLFVFTAIFPAFGFSESPQVAGSERLKASEEAIREQMMVISRQLGVTCSACHNLKNFASTEKPEFGVSKEHMKITQILIDSGMDGRDKRPKADCFMCHRGQLKPNYKEPYDKLKK